MVKVVSSFVYIQRGAYVVTFLLSIVCILIGNLDTTTWPLPVNLALPFSSETLYGWYAVYFIYLNMEFTYGSSMIPATSLFVSACAYIIAICDHFNHVVRATNDDVVRMNAETNSLKYYEMVGELHKKVCQSIKIHNKVYE